MSVSNVGQNVRARWKVMLEAWLANTLHIYENSMFKVPLEKVVRRSLRGLD
jgi:hypothetical protein